MTLNYSSEDDLLITFQLERSGLGVLSACPCYPQRTFCNPSRSKVHLETLK
jgi:hypothetical protein